LAALAIQAGRVTPGSRAPGHGRSGRHARRAVA